MDYQRTILKNGLRVITAPMREVESVSLAVFVGVGYRYESRSQNGLSHFLEHLVFKGSKKYPSPLAISKTIEGMGGVANGWTDAESTGFWVKTPRSHLKKGAAVLFDIVLNPLLEREALERERGVVLEEIHYRLDNPEIYVGELFSQAVFPNQPLGHKVLEERRVVKLLTRSQLWGYFKGRYQPKAMLVVASGKVRHRETVMLAEKYLAGLKPLPLIAPQKAAPRQGEPRFSLLFRKTEQAHLNLGFWGLSSFSEDRFVLEVLHSILGRGMSSRLFAKVREELGLAYSIGTHGELYRDSGVFLVHAGLSVSRVGEALKVVLDEFGRLKKEFVAGDELRAAKEKIKGPLLFKLESSDQIVQFLGGQELLTPGILTPRAVVEKVEAVTADDVQRVARKLFVRERLNAALIGPFRDGFSFLRLLKSY